jgi:CHAD domain-containing protein
MTHELSRSKDLSHEVQRVLLEQMEAAESDLAGGRLSEAAIHQARKALKKARATLRLLRESVPDSVYRQENRALRDIARPLSAARDATVLIETLGKLQKLYGQAATESIPPPLLDTLKGEQFQAHDSADGSKGKRPTASRQIRTVKQRLARAPVAENSWDGVGTALKRAYRNGRRAMKHARRTPAAEGLHEWRKQSKHLWYQMQVLQPLWPGMVEELGDQLHRLSDYLGDDHDLVVLRQKVAQLQPAFADSGNSGALLALIDRCRARLQEKAFLLGGRIYDEAPKDFVARFERYWKRWRKEKIAPANPDGGRSLAAR